MFLRIVVSLACAVAISAILARPGATQSGNTCVSAGSGAWDDPVNWTHCGSGVPGATDNAYIQSGHTITLTRDEAVADLHISTGTTTAYTGADGKLALGVYRLDVYGKLRNYFGVLSETPGTSSQDVGTAPVTMTANSSGRLRFVGTARIITGMGEWSSANMASSTTFAVEIALTQNQTATMQTAIKASAWTITSGILDTGVNRLIVDNGVAGAGNVTVAEGATLLSSASSSGSPIFSRASKVPGGTLIVSGTLLLKGPVPFIAMSSLMLSGTVEYAATGMQTLASAANGGATPDTYGHLRLSGSGIRSLVMTTTVAGKFTRADAVTLNAGAYSLIYAPGATLEYAGTNAQTTGPELGAMGVDHLTISNSAGVTLATNAVVSGTLNLAGGDLATGPYVLTLAPGATCTGIGDVVGTVARTEPGVGQAHCFGHPDVQVTVAAGSTPPAALEFTLAKGVAPFAGAALRSYTISAPGFAGTATLRLHYPAGELGGKPITSLQLWRQADGHWSLQPWTAAGTDYVEKNDVTAFSTWALAANTAPTAVSLASFDARVDGDHVLLRWITGHELTNWGFYLYRAGGPGGTPVRINATMIPAQGPGSSMGYSYAWEDHPALYPGTTYWYWLEDIDIRQVATRHPPVQVVVAGQGSLYLPFAGTGSHHGP